MKYNLMNYTSTVPPQKTISEIEYLLASAGARKIAKDYDDNQNVAAFFFSIPTINGELTFRMPCNVDAVFDFFMAQVKRPKKNTAKNLREQAERVAWRILLDWTDAQLSMIAAHRVKPEQAFFAYVYDPRSGQTLFENFEKRGMLMLTDGD